MDNYEKYIFIRFREQFFDILKEERIQPNQYVINQGETGDRFYIVIDGKLVAEKSCENDEKQIVYQYREGDYFGELSLVHDIDRQASIKTLTACRLVSIDRDTFRRILGPMKQILQRNESRYEQLVC